MDTSKITDVLIFKGGYYYLTTTPVLTRPDISNLSIITDVLNGWYYIIEPKEFEIYGIDRNGFEFASDAYAYIASLNPLREPRKNGVHLVMTDEVYDKEEERLKEMGEV